LEIMSHMKGANYQDYFLNWGKIWCVKAREQYVQLLLAVDVHSPAELRANMQPRNFAEFYRTFNVKKGDGMYLEPAKRIVIW
jgi:putative endopeptidase